MRKVIPHLLIIVGCGLLLITGIITNSSEIGRFIGAVAGVSVDPIILWSSVTCGIFFKEYKYFLIFLLPSSLIMIGIINFVVKDWYVQIGISHSFFELVNLHRFIGFVVVAHIANLLRVFSAKIRS